jgi:anti-sigma regulatory factor (Ser/Thr protein kinase)
MAQVARTTTFPHNREKHPMTPAAANHSAPAPIEIRIQSDPAAIAAVRHAAESFAAQRGLDDKAVADIGLAVNEALANIIRHAYHDQHDRPIVIRMNFSKDTFTVDFRDWGTGVNPASLSPKPPNPHKPGGLGLVCLRTCMDSLVYHPQPDGMLMQMTKTRKRK